MSAAQKIKPQIEIKLVILKGPHAGQRFTFSKPEIAIGRSPENDIVLLNDASISRMHAKIQVLNNEVEVVNVSQKNSIVVNGESVQKWKLLNDGTFLLGDCEFKINFDLGQSVVAVTPAAIKVVDAKSLQPAAPAKSPRSSPSGPAAVPANLKLVKSQQAVARNPGQLQQRSHPATPMHPGQNPHLGQRPAGPRPAVPYPGAYQQHPASAKPVSGGLLRNPKSRFYILIVAILVVAGYFYLMPDTKKADKKADAKPLLKYEDEVAIKLNSKSEEAENKKIRKAVEEKNSPMNARAEENFIKGMRDFQLGNYLRAQEFFQVVLNLQPDHQLSRRHLYLSKVRFDELVKAKIMLGESYYQKHNFRMCYSLYNQVLVMLQGKSSDQNYKLAEHMMEKCRLASEGIR